MNLDRIPTYYVDVSSRDGESLLSMDEEVWPRRRAAVAPSGGG
jgi:hypothetical protein